MVQLTTDPNMEYSSKEQKSPQCRHSTCATDTSSKISTISTSHILREVPLVMCVQYTRLVCMYQEIKNGEYSIVNMLTDDHYIIVERLFYSYMFFLTERIVCYYIGGFCFCL